MNKTTDQEEIVEETLNSGISTDYVKTWDVEKAVREIVQNWLDVKAEKKCNGTIAWEKPKDGGDLGWVRVKDDNPEGLEKRHLSLGISEKGPDAIGKFGEGLKLALLVLAREDRGVHVRSNGRVIRPIINYGNYQTETLDFHLTPMEPRHAATHVGTSIRFQCTKDELKAGKAYFTAFKTTKVNWVEQGKISRPGGRVFINGAAVGELPDALFSYHINGEDGTSLGNRDRTSISQKDLEPVIQRMLSKTKSQRVMELILQDVKDEGKSYEAQNGFNEYALPSQTKRTWKRAANKVLGKETLISRGETAVDQQAVYRGFKVFNPGYAWRGLLEMAGMTRASDLAKVCKSLNPVTKMDTLTDAEKRTFTHAMNLVGEHYNKPGKVQVCESLVIGRSGQNADGIYTPKTDTISLSRKILQDLRRTVATLLHETVHKVSGESDCTAKFENALLDVSLGMMGLNPLND